MDSDPELKRQLKRFAQGRCSLATLSELGVQVDVDDRSLVIAKTSEIVAELQLEDVANGLLMLKDRFQDLRCWATVLLGGSNLFDLEDRFESYPRGDVLLGALWDITFGDRPSAQAIEVAGELLGTQTRTNHWIER